MICSQNAIPSPVGLKEALEILSDDEILDKILKEIKNDERNKRK